LASLLWQRLQAAIGRNEGTDSSDSCRRQLTAVRESRFSARTTAFKRCSGPFPNIGSLMLLHLKFAIAMMVVSCGCIRDRLSKKRTSKEED